MKQSRFSEEQIIGVLREDSAALKDLLGKNVWKPGARRQR
jgi:hypothetical protein